MKNQALIVIDLQNDITKNYHDIIENVNAAIAWAVRSDMQVVYIRHNNLSAGTRTFKPDTRGAELVQELDVVNGNIFTKTKGNALTSEAFADFIDKNGIHEFFVTGADATACVKSTCYNMRKAGYAVTVLRDCVTSYDTGKIAEMLEYYQSKGCAVQSIEEVMK